MAGGRRPPGRARPTLSVLVTALIGGLLVLLGAPSASAHATLLSTTPADGAVLERAPAEVVLTFNEPVQLIDGSIRLFAGDGDPVVLDAHVSDARVVAPFPGETDEGRYALSYRVVSADGHPISGAISFTIGDVSAGAPVDVVDAQVSPATQIAVRVLTVAQYLSLLVFAGLNLFDRAVLGNRGAVDRRSARVLRWAGAGAAAASILLVPVLALNVTGDPLTAIVRPTVWRAGVLWQPVVAAAVTLVGVLAAYALAIRSPRRGQVRALVLVPALAALGTPVLVGHTQLIGPRALMIASDLGHLLAGSFWAGGLLGLLLCLAAARVVKGGDDGSPPVRAAHVVERFSRLAVWTVVILAASGTVMAVRIVGSFGALFGTGYGWTLLAKLGVLLPVVAVAAYNRFRLLPAISADPTAHQQWRRLTGTLRAEAGLLVVVLIITGLLTNLSPAHESHDHAVEETAAEPVAISAAAQGLAIEGALEPARVGDNVIAFSLSYEDQPVAPEQVTIQVTLPEHDLGPFEISPELDPGTGEYTAPVRLPVAGEWQVEVVARVSTFAEPIITVPVTVP